MTQVNIFCDANQCMMVFDVWRAYQPYLVLLFLLAPETATEEKKSAGERCKNFEIQINPLLTYLTVLTLLKTTHHSGKL